MSLPKIVWPSLVDYAHLSGRAADTADVDAGRAVFVAEINGQRVGRPMPIPLPQYAFQIDHETQERIPCIAIQAEEANGLCLVGCRRVADGQDVVGLMSDFELLGTTVPRGR